MDVVDPKNIEWRWDGERRLVLFFDDIPVIEIRRLKTPFTTMPPFAWYLHDRAGNTIWVRESGVDREVWHEKKPVAQRLAMQHALAERTRPA